MDDASTKPKERQSRFGVVWEAAIAIRNVSILYLSTLCSGAVPQHRYLVSQLQNLKEGHLSGIILVPSRYETHEASHGRKL